MARGARLGTYTQQAVEVVKWAGLTWQEGESDGEFKWADSLGVRI